MSDIATLKLESNPVTVAEAKRRVRMVLLALAGVAFTFIATLGVGLRLFSENIQNQVAIAAAGRNATYIASVLSATDPVAQSIEALSSELAGSSGIIYEQRIVELRNTVMREYRRINAEGTIVESSRQGEIGARMPDEAMNQLRQGIRVDTRIDMMRGNTLPTGVAMSYAPLIVDGEFTGAIGVWADRTADSRDAVRQVEIAYLVVGGVFFIFALLTGTILRRYLLQRFLVENELSMRTRELVLGEAVAQFGHWSISSRPMRVSLSTEAERLVGRPTSQGDISLDDFAALFAEADRASIKAGFLDLLEGRSSMLELETRAQQKDGRLHDLRLVAKRRIDGADVGLFGVVMDITTEKEFRRTLKEGEQKFRLLTDNASDVISFYDENRVLWYVSPSVERVTGYTPDEVMGQDTFDVVHPDDLPALLTRRGFTEAGIGNGDTGSALWRLRHKKGHYIWMESSVSIISNPNGERQMVSIARDVTERVERDNQLKAAREQLEANAEELRVLAQELDLQRERAENANAAKSQFLAVMSHELRTPLTGVIGMADLLQGSQLDAEQTRQVEMLRRSARLLLDQLNEILDLSKIESGKMELESIDFRVSDVLADVNQLMSPVASEKGLVLRLPRDHVPTDLVRGDPKRLRQVLINLVGNAIKFTTSGTVGVTAAQRVNGDAFELTFDIVDTGIGIAKEDLPKLFKPFTQAEASTARRFGGTGLGLTISKRFAEAMGGGISVSSEPGKGSTFTLTVRMARASGANVEVAAAPTVAAQLPPLRVLLAEDTETTRYLVAAMLTRQGHHVTAVEDGAQAVDAVKEGAFDIALIDMHMPVVDGPDAVKMIRAMPGAKSKLPIIALTADVLSPNVKRYRSVGVDAVVAKPVDWPLLSAEMARLTHNDVIASPMTPSNDDAVGSDAFNQVMIDEIRGLLGADGMRGLLTKFAVNIEVYRDKLLAAHSNGDVKAVIEAAHALRGVAAQFGADRLSDLAKQIEEAGGEHAQTAALSHDLVNAVTAAQREVKKQIAA